MTALPRNFAYSPSSGLGLSRGLDQLIGGKRSDDLLHVAFGLCMSIPS